MSVNEGRVVDVMKKIGRGVKKELTREKPLFGPESPYPLLRGRKARKAAAEKLKNENSYERIYNILTESTPIGREGSKKHGREMGQWIGQDLEAIKTARRHPDRERGEHAARHTIPKEIGLWKSFARRKGRELVSTDPKTKAIRAAGQKRLTRSNKRSN